MKMINALEKKLKRLERKYARLPKSAKLQKMRIAKSYKATIKKIEHLTGKELLP